MEKIKLFCIPWAGGSSISFYKWKQYLAEWIELIPIELSGRGYRHSSPLYSTFEEAVEDVYHSISTNLDHSPYALFGHSMGSLIAYEISHKIKKLGIKEPDYLFMSGRWAPNIIKINPIHYNMSDEELKMAMISMGGTSEKLFTDNEFINMVYPTLRADIKITEEYKYRERCCKLDSCIAAITGISDISVSYDDLLEWHKHTNNEFNICKFRGGHFFINDSMESVVKYINNQLANQKYIQ